MIEKLKELAVEVSIGEETDDVHYLPPLKVLSFLARRLSSSSSSSSIEKSAPVTANKTSQTDQESRCEDFSSQTDLPQPSQPKPSLSSTDTETAPPCAKVQVFKSKLVPILPKPKFESKSGSVPAEKNKEADTPLNDNNFQARKSKQSEDDFLDDLLGNLGNKIASIIPENVSSQNICDIVEEGINNEDIFADLMSMYGDSAASDGTADTTGDSRVNTPVTSPLPDLMEVEEPSNVVTEPFEKQVNPAAPATSDQSQTTNRRKRKKPKSVPDPSKKTKNQEGVEGTKVLSNFRRQFGGVVSSATTANYPETEKDTNVKETAVENNMIAAITSMVKESNKERSEEQIVGEKERHISTEYLKIIADPSDLDENIVVEVLEEGLKVEEKSRRRERCNKCPGCQAPPCGQCPECKDKRANGGPGVLKKACRRKPCDNLRNRKRRPSSLKLEQNIENIQPEGKSPPVHRGLSKQQPFHVRNLVFSPPRGKQESPPQRQQALIKTLSPEKSASSPLKSTDPAWNESCNGIFQPPDREQVQSERLSEKDPAEETKSGSQTTLNPNRELVDISKPPNPYLIKKDMTDLNKPLLVPISADLIPSSAVVQTLPPGYKSLGYSAVLNQPNISSINKLNVEQAVSSSAEKSEETDGQNNKISVTEHNLEAGMETGAKIVESRRTPKNSSKVAGTKKSKQKPKTWDENLRAVLGSAEKDVSHISHKLSEKEKKVKWRSPKKIIYEENAESGDEENI